MSDLISRSALMERLLADYLDAIEEAEVTSISMNGAYCRVEALIDEFPTVEAIPLREVYRLIAGHSNYHGDSILSALTCVTEGKEVKPIKPLEESVEIGNWIPVEMAFYYIYKCSKYGKVSLGKSKFCAECGSRMVEKHD